MPISHHFHDCTALLVWHFVVVKWRYTKYEALPFTFNLYSRFVPISVLEVHCIRSFLLVKLNYNNLAPFYGTQCNLNARKNLINHPPQIQSHYYSHTKMFDVICNLFRSYQHILSHHLKHLETQNITQC